LEDCLKARYEENVRRHCGQRLVFAVEANRRKDVNAAELGAAILICGRSRSRVVVSQSHCLCLEVLDALRWCEFEDG
jgi:hypothetical protein